MSNNKDYSLPRPLTTEVTNEIATASNLLPVCLICGETPAEGIRGGILILKKFLCHHCEADIIGLTQEHPRYEQVKEQLKKLWS